MKVVSLHLGNHGLPSHVSRSVKWPHVCGEGELMQKEGGEVALEKKIQFKPPLMIQWKRLHVSPKQNLMGSALRSKAIQKFLAFIKIEEMSLNGSLKLFLQWNTLVNILIFDLEYLLHYIHTWSLPFCLPFLSKRSIPLPYHMCETAFKSNTKELYKIPPDHSKGAPKLLYQVLLYGFHICYRVISMKLTSNKDNDICESFNGIPNWQRKCLFT